MRSGGGYRGELVLWTPDGVWYQFRDCGQIRSSYLGRQSLPAVASFCRKHGLLFEVFESKDCVVSHSTSSSIAAQ